MLKLKSNQFISDVIKNFSVDGSDLNIVQELEPFNGICVVLKITDNAILKCNKNIQLCNLIKLLLQSVFFLDYDILKNTGAASTSLNFKCPMFDMNYNVSISIDRTFVNNILTLDIIYNFYDGPMTNDPYFTLTSKLVSRNDILENSIKQNSSGFIVPQYIIPATITSINYASEDHSAFEIDIEKCNLRLIRSVDRFTDNKICMEIPASISVSFCDDTSTQINNCIAANDIKNAINNFLNKSHLVTTNNYTIDNSGIQTGLSAKSSVVIDKYLFDLSLTVQHNNPIFQIELVINIIKENNIVLKLIFSETINEIDGVFNGLTLNNPTIDGNIEIIDCSNINTQNICSDMYTPGYIEPRSQYAKFDYIIVDTSNNNLYIIKNINIQGSQVSFHKRNDCGLNSIDDYINLTGDLEIACAIPISMSYNYWFDQNYGKFTDSTISLLLGYNWSGEGYNFIGIYDLDSHKIKCQLGCLL